MFRVGKVNIFVKKCQKHFENLEKYLIKLISILFWSYDFLKLNFLFWIKLVFIIFFILWKMIRNISFSFFVFHFNNFPRNCWFLDLFQNRFKNVLDLQFFFLKSILSSSPLHPTLSNQHEGRLKRFFKFPLISSTELCNNKRNKTYSFFSIVTVVCWAEPWNSHLVCRK